MQIKKIASFDVKDGASTVRYADLDDGISFFPTDGIINIKSNKVRIAGFGVDSNSLYRINSSGAMYPLGDSNSVFLSNEGLLSSASIGGSSGNNKWVLAISDNFGVTDSGTLYARNATINGNITAKYGSIASYTIDGDYLMSTDQQVGLSAGATAFWAGYNKNNGSYKFRVMKDGTFTATNADITGTINASKGEIADYTINGAMLVGHNVGLSGTVGQGLAFWAGSNDAANAPFRIGHDGSLVATTGTIAGWHINSNGIWQQNSFGNVSVTTGVGKIDAIETSDIDFLRVQKSDGTYPFYVHKDGEMYCSKATIAGDITATVGKIASFTIDGDYLMSTDQQVGLSAGATAFWAGYNAGDGSYKFKVMKDGTLTVANATIVGSTIEGGTINAQHIQTNTREEIKGVDIWTGAIRLSKLRAQNWDTGNIDVYANTMWLSDGTKLSSGPNAISRQKGYPVVSTNGHGLGMYWDGSNLHVVIDITDYKIQLIKN